MIFLNFILYPPFCFFVDLLDIYSSTEILYQAKKKAISKSELFKIEF